MRHSAQTSLACRRSVADSFLSISTSSAWRVYVASAVAFCTLWSKIIGGHFQPAGAFAFWSVALGAIPAIWDVILGFIAPDMDWNTVGG